MKSLSAPMAPWVASGIVLCALCSLTGDVSFRQVAFAAQTKAPSSQGAAFVPAYPACPARRPLPTPLPLESDVPYCIHMIVAGETLGMIAQKNGTTLATLMRANRAPRVPEQKKVTNRNGITAGALLLIPTPSFSRTSPAPEGTSFPHPIVPPESPLRPPVSEDPSAPSHAHAPPLSTDENRVQALEDGKDGQKALQTAVQQQGTYLAGLLDSQQNQGQQLEQLGKDMAMLKRGQEHLTHTLAALRKDTEQRLSHLSVTKTVALALLGVFTFVTLGAFLVRVSLSRPHQPVPSSETAGHDMQHAATPKVSREESASMDIHIATQYLSAPKHEDVIRSAFAPGLYAIVLADGASSYRCSGGETSGGGREAATIAAQTAITYLTSHMLPSMGIDEMMVHLHGCFSVAHTELEHHNASTTTPGGTTLLISLLCQGGNGLWYWLYGNLGNGVLALLHSQQLLAGLPIHTPLLSKHSNGATTITMPGYGTKGYVPSVGCRPHSPGDVLVIGSDGLDHLDKVTRKRNSFDFHNYLWTQIQHERSHLSVVLQGLQNERAEAEWLHALELDDTTIGILWA